GLRILVSFLPIQGLSSLGGVAMVAGSRRWLVTWYLQSGSRETRAHVQLSPFYSFGAMVCGMMPPTVRMDCLSSVQSF
ncbi:mCG1031401, partial [Mus musculus]